MTRGDGAFDMHAKEDTEHDRHDAGHLLHHVWTIVGDQLCPVGGGYTPSNATPALLSTIPRTAITTHRWKDKSVIALLASGQYRHET